MAINVKKGSDYSLLQVDYIGIAPSPQEGIVPGSGCRVGTDGVIHLGASASPTPTTDLLGFAINDQNDGDVIESGKIGLYLISGGSVVETDQAAAAITPTNYPIGAKVTFNTSGQVAVTTSSDQIVGQVDGIRTLPALITVNSSQGVATQVQGSTAFVAIKLAASV